MSIEGPWGALLVMVLFNMFINDLEERLGSTFIKLAYALEKYQEGKVPRQIINMDIKL